VIDDSYTAQIDGALSADDPAAIAHALSRMEIADFAKSLQYLLRSWSHFMDEIEQGYDLTIFDYLNDVSTRDILDRVAQQVPADTAERLAALLRPLDDRFVAATVVIDRHVGTGIFHLDDPPRAQDQWYYTRVPSAPGPRLASELKEFGIGPRVQRISGTEHGPGG
jgi:hypothetical protein